MMESSCAYYNRRKVENKSGVSTFDLLDFLIAIVHVAYHRYAAESPDQAAYQQLSFKLMTLFRDCFNTHTFQDLGKKLTKFDPALQNSAAMLLLKRGRK